MTTNDIHIKKLSQRDESLWDRYVSRHPEATFFHRSGWKKVIEDSTGHPGTYLMALDNNIVVGVYPLFIISTGLFGLFGISLPFVNYGGILADSVDVEKMLIDEAEAIGKSSGCSYIELHQRSPLKCALPSSRHKIASLIPLQGGAEHVFSRLHQNVRNKIRKSKKNGVIVQRGNAHLSDFYQIYSRNLRDLGTPVLTKRFFESVITMFPDEAVLYRATRQGKTIGAKIVLMDSKTCYFEWSASLKESLRYAPVHAMNWQAIEDACSAGCEHVDFGRSTADSSHQQFKKYWGIESRPMSWAYQLLNRTDIPGLQKENPKFDLAIRVWKKMPIFLSRLIGPPIARRLP